MTTQITELERDEHRRIFDSLRRRVPKPQFETWFARTRVARLTGVELVLTVPNQFQQEWMTREYRGHVAGAAEETLGHRVDVRFEVMPAAMPGAAEGHPAPADTERDAATLLRGADAHGAGTEPARTLAPATPAAAGPASPVAVSPSMAPQVTSPAPAGSFPGPFDPYRLVLQPRYTFDNFVVGPSNQMAHAAARAVADDPGTTNNPLFLYGAVGLGKTHLLQGICHEILRRRPEHRIVYMSCEQFTNEYVSAVQRNATEAFRNRFRNVDMLVVDDIHFLANKERTQEEFFHTFNALYQSRRQIILSCDAPPADIPTLEERLVSRFKWGLVEKLEQPETETRMAIIRRKADWLALHLPDDVVEYIATNVRNNIREIEGAIASVRSRAVLERRPVDLALARAALEPALQHDQPAVGLDRITQVVASHYGVKVTDLRSKKRTKSISLPRQVVMHLAREETGLSLVEIGEYFGGRDHTTVLYATGKIADRVAREEVFRSLVERLKDRIRAR